MRAFRNLLLIESRPDSVSLIESTLRADGTGAVPPWVPRVQAKMGGVT